LYIPSLREFFVALGLPSVIAYILISVPLELIYAFLMTEEGGTKIKYRTVWMIMDYFNLILQLVRGVLNFFMKIIYWLCFFVIYLMRLDEPTIPSAWRFLDTPYCSFWGILI
jgi:hypothetical protein